MNTCSWLEWWEWRNSLEVLVKRVIVLWLLGGTNIWGQMLTWPSGLLHDRIRLKGNSLDTQGHVGVTGCADFVKTSGDADTRKSQAEKDT